MSRILLIIKMRISRQKMACMLGALVMAAPASFSQPVHSDLYARIASILPLGWAILEDGNRITATLKEPVWSYNAMNAPPVMDMCEHSPSPDKKTQYRIVVEYTGRWSEHRLDKAKWNNDDMRNEEIRLYEKYRLKDIRNKNGDYVPANDDERRRLKGYAGELKAVKDHIIRLPDINTAMYSIFISDNTSGPGFIVCPHDAAQEGLWLRRKIIATLADPSGDAGAGPSTQTTTSVESDLLSKKGIFEVQVVS